MEDRKPDPADFHEIRAAMDKRIAYLLTLPDSPAVREALLTAHARLKRWRRYQSQYEWRSKRGLVVVGPQD